MKIGIVIVNYNGTKDTQECLESLSKVDKKDLDILTVVVDNNSNTPFKSVKKYEDINLQIVESKVNLGFSGGNNLGIEKCLAKNCDYVLLLNNDTILDPKFLLSLLKPFKDEKVGIVSPKIYFYKGREFHKDRYSKQELGKVIWYAGGILDNSNILASHRGVDEVDRGQFNEISETDFATGCCMLIRREVFEKIGLLDQKYFLYLEDLDFSIRAKKANFKIVFVPDSIVWHKNAGSTGGSGSSLQDYFYSRNRMIFGMKYANIRAKNALIRESLRLLLSGREMQKQGIKDYYLRNFGKGSLNI